MEQTSRQTNPQINAAATSFETTVLVVDDIPESMDMLVEALLQVGHKVLVADSGQQALGVINHAIEHRSLPDIILLDVTMPGIDGFETCRQIKTYPEAADIPILFVTAHGESIQKVRGFDVGGADYIMKPFELSEVKARINTHLTIRRLRMKLQAENNELLQQLQDHIVQLEVAIEGRKMADQEITYLREERDKLVQMVQASQSGTRRKNRKLAIDLSILSEREREVLELIGASKNDHEIAEALVVTPSTVRTHRARIMSKLDINSPMDLMKVAMQTVDS